MDKDLVNHFTWLANSMAECTAYDSWSAELKERHIKEAFETFYNSLKKDTNKHLVDLETMTAEKAKELRFRRWDENMPNLWLLPLWFVPILPIGTELTSIFGEKLVYDGNNIDLDIRFGCIAYGIELPQPPKGEPQCE